MTQSAGVSTREAADLLGCSPRTVRRMCELGTLSSYRIGKDIRVLRESLERLISEGVAWERGRAS